MASFVDGLHRMLPFLPRMSLQLARLLCAPDRAERIGQILAQDRILAKRPVAIYLATPRRFLRPDRLARKRTALTNLLAMIEAAQAAALAQGLGLRIVAVEHLARLPRAGLVFSHHTVEDALFGRLRADGCVVWHFKTGDLPDSLTIDAGGFSGWSTLATRSLAALGLEDIDLAEAEAFFAERQAAVIGGNLSKYQQPTVGPMTPLPQPYVFVALQTIGDMVQRQAHIPMLEMLRIVVERFAGTGMTVAIKRHPKCRSAQVWRALAAAAAQPHVRLVDGSIHQLLAGASALITVNSGVGSEAMLHRVPIYCFGGADYAPIAHSIRSAAAFRALTDPIRPATSAEDLVRFHFYYRTVHQTVGSAALHRRVDRLVADFIRARAETGRQ